jgi:hypothetical protein
MAWSRSLACILLVGCKDQPSKLDPVTEGAPRQTRISLDGELSEPAWNQLAIRGVFTADGAQARPYSEIRLLRDETHLFVALYAADEDIRSDDEFVLAAPGFSARFSAAGRATPATIRVAIDRDGTLDNPGDDDEEWVVEAAIPLSAFGPPPIAMTAERCDRTKDGSRRCASWHGAIDPSALPLIR